MERRAVPRTCGRPALRRQLQRLPQPTQSAPWDTGAAPCLVLQIKYWGPRGVPAVTEGTAGVRPALLVLEYCPTPPHAQPLGPHPASFPSRAERTPASGSLPSRPREMGSCPGAGGGGAPWGRDKELLQATRERVPWPAFLFSALRQLTSSSFECPPSEAEPPSSCPPHQAHSLLQRRSHAHGTRMAAVSPLHVGTHVRKYA